MTKENVTIDIKKVHETDAAILINDGDNDVWIPSSQISEIVLDRNDEGHIVIPYWLAFEKELV